MKSPIVQFFFRFMWIKRGIGVVVIMLWVLSSSVVHAKNNPFAPADQVGPYKIGYKRVELVDPSRDAAFGGRTQGINHLPDGRHLGVEGAIDLATRTWSGKFSEKS